MPHRIFCFHFFFFFNDTATTEIYTLSLHDALPIFAGLAVGYGLGLVPALVRWNQRSEEHTSELQSQSNLVCRLLLEKKKNQNKSKHEQKLYNNNKKYSKSVIEL